MFLGIFLNKRSNIDSIGGVEIMRKIVKMGSIGAAVIIVLAVLPTIVSAHEISIRTDTNSLAFTLKSTKSINEKTNIFQQIMKNMKMNWEPGEFFYILLGTLAAIFIALFGWMFLP